MFSLFVRRDGLIDPPAIGEFDGHCHILPEIDDGPSTVEDAIKIAQILVEMGIKTVAATPHVISDVYPNTKKTILYATQKIQTALTKNNIALTVVPAAEYYAEYAFLELIEQHDILYFGPNKYVLFELPVEQPPMILENIIFQLKSAGYTPLLAHAERYRFLQKSPALVEKLKSLGVHFQINHPSFMLPKTSVRGEMARKLYVKGYVDVLGTDMHRATPLHRPQQKQKKGFRSFMGRKRV